MSKSLKLILPTKVQEQRDQSTVKSFPNGSTVVTRPSLAGLIKVQEDFCISPVKRIPAVQVSTGLLFLRNNSSNSNSCSNNNSKRLKKIENLVASCGST